MLAAHSGFRRPLRKSDEKARERLVRGCSCMRLISSSSAYCSLLSYSVQRYLRPSRTSSHRDSTKEEWREKDLGSIDLLPTNGCFLFRLVPFPSSIHSLLVVLLLLDFAQAFSGEGAKELLLDEEPSRPIFHPFALLVPPEGCLHGFQPPPDVFPLPPPEAIRTFCSLPFRGKGLMAARPIVLTAGALPMRTINEGPPSYPEEGQMIRFPPAEPLLDLPLDRD